MSIYVGCAIGPTDRFERLLEPTLRELVQRHPETRVLTSRGSSNLAWTYNEFIDLAVDDRDCSALLLVHDDVEIRDRNLIPKIDRLLRDGRVGVVGCIGARGIWQSRWWKSAEKFGSAADARQFQWLPPIRADVDAVDGFFMVLARSAMLRVRFDDDVCSGFHCYDVDYCLSARERI